MKRIIQNTMIRLILGCLILCGIMSIDLLASRSYNGVSTSDRWMSDDMIRHPIGLLRTSGCDVNDIEDIKQAAITGNPIMRNNAIWLLAYKSGPQAIPTLKQGLNDPYPRVRCTAARMMAIISDRSGLERMHRDIIELTKDDQEESKKEGDSQTEKKDIPLTLQSKSGRLTEALRAAYVLAEFGDNSGYKLAVKTALKGESAYKRSEAIKILTELGRTIDEDTLKARGIDPEAVLITVAESEKNPSTLFFLSAYVKANMRMVSQIRILEKLLKSPHLSDSLRQRTKTGVERIKKRLEQEKQEKDKEKTQEQNQKLKDNND